MESQRVSSGKLVGFQWKAFLKKILLDFLLNSGGFHQANPDLNPGGFPVEFHWDSGRIPLGFQWNSSGIPEEILLGFWWKMLGFRWNFCRDSAFFLLGGSNYYTNAIFQENQEELETSFLCRKRQNFIEKLPMFDFKYLLVSSLGFSGM